MCRARRCCTRLTPGDIGTLFTSAVCLSFAAPPTPQSVTLLFRVSFHVAHFPRARAVSASFINHYGIIFIFLCVRRPLRGSPLVRSCSGASTATSLRPSRMKGSRRFSAARTRCVSPVFAPPCVCLLHTRGWKYTDNGNIPHMGCVRGPSLRVPNR